MKKLRACWQLFILTFLVSCQTQPAKTYDCVLHDQNNYRFYNMPSFSVDPFINNLEITRQKEGMSCLCGADYLIYTYKNGMFDTAIVVYRNQETDLQIISTERTDDLTISKDSENRLKYHISSALKAANEIENFQMPDSVFFE